MSAQKTQTRDLKKLLGNPKITFVLGGPASGKGTQCAKLVEEFGFTHISTGDLFRAEQAKGTKEGERIKKIMTEGGLVPYELTVQILINALIANPSKNILIDGFPRQVEQAIYFEQNVCEAQNVLFYDLSEETMLQRCLKRAETSDRDDDKEEILKKRLAQYNQHSKPVVELYEQFGKVRRIDASKDINEVYEQTKKAMLPSISFILGPKTSGKSTLGKALAERSNMKFIDFNTFVQENGLVGKKDEVVTGQLIKNMIDELSPRVLIKNFPQNLYQAKYFIKNCTNPSKVFSLKCTKDVSQERMIQLGFGHPQYVSSSILSKKISHYNEQAKELLPFLKEHTEFHELDTTQTFQKSFESISKTVEPVVIHIRNDSASDELRNEMIQKLTSEHGFVNLNIHSLITNEKERRTDIGMRLLNDAANGKKIDSDLQVAMLKKIIYSGQDSRNKFILSAFPDTIEHAKIFEEQCSKISAIIYATKKESIVEVKDNNLQSFNIDALFQKSYKLRVIDEWNYRTFQEKLGNKIDYGVVHGRSLSGKSEVCKQISTLLGHKIIEMKAMVDDIKKKLGTDEEPFDGEVSDADIQKEILSMINNDKASGSKSGYVFDSFSHKEVDQFVAFLSELGPPDFLIHCWTEQKQIDDRFKKKNEVEEIGEDAQEELKRQEQEGKDIKTKLEAAYGEMAGRVNVVNLNCAGSLELTVKELSNQFVPKIVLINHEKDLKVDTPCANLSIKYNMLYISVYQAIRSEIKSQSELGKQLEQHKRLRHLNIQTQGKDEFQEADFSAAHFRPDHVIAVIKKVISTQRTNQRFILIEGLINSGKLSSADDKLESRFMDELFLCEKHIGDVVAIIGLQYLYEKEYIEEQEIEYEVFEPKEEPQKKEKVDGDDDGDGDDGANDGGDGDGDDADKAKKFDPRDFDKWTVTDRKPKNLPQLYMQMKGINTHHEQRNWDQYSNSKLEAVHISLNDFCNRLVEGGDSSDKYLYQQVIFSD